MKQNPDSTRALNRVSNYPYVVGLRGTQEICGLLWRAAVRPYIFATSTPIVAPLNHPLVDHLTPISFAGKSHQVLAI